MNYDGLSYAALHRIAVREADRVELGRAINAIERSTHAVAYKRDAARVCCYGSLTECQDFAQGIERDVEVVPFTVDMKNVQSAHKVRVYRGIRP